MDLNFSVMGEVRVTIVDYLKRVIADLPDDIMKIPPTPTRYHMFEVSLDKENNILDK